MARKAKQPEPEATESEAVDPVGSVDDDMPRWKRYRLEHGLPVEDEA